MGLAKAVVLLLLAPVALAVVAAAGFFIVMLSISLYEQTIGEYVINPWKHIPVVKHTGSWFSTLMLGDFEEIKKAQPAEAHAEWITEHGGVYRYRHMFGRHRIMITDPKAILYIHGPSRAYKYPKPDNMRKLLGSILGDGLVSIEGDQHRRQRRILSPAFTNAAVRDLQPVMEKHSAALTKKLEWFVDQAMARKAGKLPKNHLIDGEKEMDRNVSLVAYKGECAVVDVLLWASRTTLDVIGEAGFNYHFGALDDGMANEFAGAIDMVMTAVMDIDLIQAVTVLLSEIKGLGWLSKIPTRRNLVLIKSKEINERKAKEIIAAAKADIAAEVAELAAPALRARASALSLKSKLSSASLRQRSGAATPAKDTSDDSGDDKATLVEGDAGKLDPQDLAAVLTKEAFDEASEGKVTGSLLHRVIRANMAADLRPNERITDDELLQIPSTFLLAGSETSATQSSWTLNLLARHPEVQERLRAEILEAVKEQASAGDPNYEGCIVGDVHKLPYLEMVIKESFRLMTAIPSTVRVTTEPDVIPLSRPYKRADGNGTYDSIAMPPNHELFVPIAAVHLSTELWGPDAAEFKPERWSGEIPAAAKPLPGPGLYSFISGPRNCIGQRFAQTEIKVIMCHLLSKLKFDVVPGFEFKQRQMVARRAVVRGFEQDGTRMPLIITKL